MSKASVLAQKEELVQGITKKFQDASAVVVVDYRGLTVEQVTELRKQLREAGIEMRVLKNTMLRRAAVAAGLQGLEDVFKGPTAVAFSNEEVVAPAKIIADFAKDAEALEIKGGVLEGRVASVEDITKLRNYQVAKAYFLCCYQYFKHQFETLHWQSKQWQRKKKRKQLNFLYGKAYSRNLYAVSFI